VRRNLFPRIPKLKPLDENQTTTPPIIESSCLHVECKLPINLRQFLARQFDNVAGSDNDSILDMAARADEATLSRVARAIRNYSTSRARQAWVECSVALADVERESTVESPAVILCLGCSQLAFGAGAHDAHNTRGCLTVNLLAPVSARGGVPGDEPATPLLDRLQKMIEDFRAMRAAFGLSHFDLDCYVTSRRVMFSWRPVPTHRSAARK
jgi:hypothetical protein